MTDRRSFLSQTTAALALGTPAAIAQSTPGASTPPAAPATSASGFYQVTQGRIKQSACHWNFAKGDKLSVEDLAHACVEMKVGSVELVGPEHWPMLKKLGLTCAIAGSHGFAKGFAHVEEHDECIAKLKASIDNCAAHGIQRVITFSGFRRGLSDEVAEKNMIDGLKKILPYAEEKKVDLCLEMLNTADPEEMKGHPDYWCDDIGKALEICRKISSPRMKILFDIYHVQIMNGDVIRWFNKCVDYIGHIHTAGNPGRHELDDRQEINYPGIMNTIAAAPNFTGYVGQEFIPRSPVKADKLRTLSDAVKLCDV